MVRSDFLNRGFPISRRVPVICFILEGKLSYTEVAYNHFDLKKIIDNNKILSCVGIWPGKKTTDAFSINPDAYCDFLLPEKFKDIDSALQITVFMENGNFDRVEYIPGPHEQDQRLHTTRDKNVYTYLINVGLKFKRSFF